MQRDELKTTIAAHGIRYIGEQDGKSVFEGRANKRRIALDIAEMDDDEAFDAIVRGVPNGRPDAEPVQEPTETETPTTLRTGPQGGLHVLVNGEWKRVRKDG